MKSNRLRLNRFKSKPMWCLTKRMGKIYVTNNFAVRDTFINPFHGLCNLEVWMRGELSMTAHTHKLIRTGFYSLTHFKAISVDPYPRRQQKHVHGASYYVLALITETPNSNRRVPTAIVVGLLLLKMIPLSSLLNLSRTRGHSIL